MLLNWAKPLQSSLQNKLFTNIWLVPLILIAIYSVIFVYFMPIGVLKTNYGFRTIDLLSPLELIIGLSALTIVLTLLIAYAKNVTALTSKQGIVIIGMCSIPFLFTYPLDALDYVANLWYSERVLIYSENPYTSIYNPENTYELTNLPATPQSPHLPYGPIWLGVHTGVYAIVRQLSLVSITFIMKILHVVLVLITFGFVLKSAEKLNASTVPPLVAVGMSPVVLYTVVGTLHNDIYFLFALSIAVYSLITKRFNLFLIFLTVSVFIKYTAAILFPFFIIWLFRSVDTRKFVKLIIPWLIYTGIIGVFSIFYLGIHIGISDQSLLFGFSPVTVFLYLSQNEQLASYVAVTFTGIFLMLFVLLTLTYLRSKATDTVWLFKICCAILLLFIFLALNLWNYWYFLWFIPFLLAYDPKSINRFLAMAFLQFVSFFVVWYLYMLYIKRVFLIEQYFMYSGIFQLFAISITIFVLTRTMIAPVAKKLL